VRAATALLRDAGRLPLRDGLAAEREAMHRVAGRANQREAVRARLDGRAPVFDDGDNGRQRPRGKDR
jgi:enoyl-CoA hydratase/carnithine racemase